MESYCFFPFWFRLVRLRQSKIKELASQGGYGLQQAVDLSLLGADITHQQCLAGKNDACPEANEFYLYSNKLKNFSNYYLLLRYSDFLLDIDSTAEALPYLRKSLKLAGSNGLASLDDSVYTMYQLFECYNDLFGHIDSQLYYINQVIGLEQRIKDFGNDESKNILTDIYSIMIFNLINDNTDPTRADLQTAHDYALKVIDLSEHFPPKDTSTIKSWLLEKGALYFSLARIFDEKNNPKQDSVIYYTELSAKFYLEKINREKNYILDLKSLVYVYDSFIQSDFVDELKRKSFANRQITILQEISAAVEEKDKKESLNSLAIHLGNFVNK